MYLKDAKPGALLRLDKNADAASADNDGHTLVFVKMNASGNGAIFLEGNYNGCGRTRLYEWNFSDLVNSYGPGSYSNYQYIKYISWPNAPAYSAAVCSHNYSKTEMPASCTEDGLATYTCSKCGDTYTEPIPALKHNYEGITTKSTCISVGYTTYTCTRCGDSYIEQDDANWSEWSTTKPTGVAESLIESRVEYRSKTKEFTTSTNSTMDGWTYCGTTFTEWGAVQTTTTKPTESDILRITNTTQTGWGYYHWCNYYYNGGNNWNVDSIAYGSPSYWHGYTSSFELPAISFPDQGGQQAYGGTGSGASPCEYNFYIWFRNTDTDVYTYSYQTRSEANQFYRWADEWSDWSDKEVISDEDCQVETRTVYRYAISQTGNHSWIDATCTEPKICATCGATEGTTIPHTFDQEKVDPKYQAGENTYYKSCICGEKGTETFTVIEEKPDEPEVKPDEPAKEFKDVPKDAYFYEAVMWAVENEVTSGTGDGTTFEPNSVCTRGQVVTFLWRAAGQPEPTKKDNPFKDVKESDYFYKAVLWAVEQNITKGTGDGSTFEPNAYCNRAQIVTFLSRAKNGQASAGYVNPFDDVASNAYYYNPVLWAVENKITTGTGDGTTFEPNAKCTRGQVITFLWRAYTK